MKAVLWAIGLVLLVTLIAFLWGLSKMARALGSNDDGSGTE